MKLSNIHLLLFTLIIFISSCETAQSISPQVTAIPPTVTDTIDEIAVNIPHINSNQENLLSPPRNTVQSVDTYAKKTEIQDLPSATAVSKPTVISTPIPTSKPYLGPDAWKRLPVVPYISGNVVQIYQRGLELGNNPNAYSKIGDCGSTPTWFMGDFDRGPKYYHLGDYQHLKDVILAFQGSHLRKSLAAKAGFNTPSLFTPLWSDPDFCAPDESPLVCEYKTHRPIIAFIMLGSNDIWHPDEFEPSMRRLIEYLIDHGVIPILSTKADNQEGDGSINHTIAHLALEYDIPLINFWRAVQDLPDGGLQEDGVHLTWGSNFFNNPESFKLAWPLRNLTALQALDAVWRKATGRNE